MWLMYILVPAYLVGCLYLTWQLIWWLKRTNWGAKHNLKWFVALLILLDIIPIIGAFLPESYFQAVCQMIGNVWFAFVLTGAIPIVIANIVKHFIKPITRKKAATVLIITVAFIVCYDLYGFLHAQEISTHYYALELNNNNVKLLKESMKDPGRYDVQRRGKTATVTRIAVLADMHMGVNTSFNTIRSLSAQVVNMKADYIIGAGDYFTSSYDGLFNAEIYPPILAKMAEKSKGAYFAYGNHDVTEPLFCGFAIKHKSKVFRQPEMDKFFEECKWNMMADKKFVIPESGIQFYFRKDASKTGDGKNDRKPLYKLLADADPDKPVVVVQHEPSDFAEYFNSEVELVISGHTHDGQIWPASWITRAASQNAHGYKTIGEIKSIVSSGVGYFGPPMRVGTHGEVVLIDLVQYK